MSSGVPAATDCMCPSSPRGLLQVHVQNARTWKRPLCHNAIVARGEGRNRINRNRRAAATTSRANDEAQLPHLGNCMTTLEGTNRPATNARSSFLFTSPSILFRVLNPTSNSRLTHLLQHTPPLLLFIHSKIKFNATPHNNATPQTTPHRHSKYSLTSSSLAWQDRRRRRQRQQVEGIGGQQVQGQLTHMQQLSSSTSRVTSQRAELLSR